MSRNLGTVIRAAISAVVALTLTAAASTGATHAGRSSVVIDGNLSASASQVAPSRVLNVTTTDEFQSALAAARPGDAVEIEAGASLVGNFVLPNKPPASGEPDWITIRTSAQRGLPPEGTRITPDFSGAMAKLVSPNAQPALRAAPGAHHFRLVGIEITIAPDVMLNYGIVTLGVGDESDASMLPHDIVIERCYIHAHAIADVSRGIALNSASTDILDSYVSDIHGIGFDTQAICGWNGPGPFKIINNYLEAAGENVLFGGADPRINNLVPSNIEFRRNDCSKPLSWKEGIITRPANISLNGSQSGGGNLISGVTYYYRVTGRGRAGYDTMATSKASGERDITLAQGQNSVNVGWDGVAHATEYRIYRTTDAPDVESRNWTYYTVTAPTYTDVGDVATATAGSTPPDTPTHWSVKNILELKNARGVVIEGNLFENNWVDAQSGFAILFTVRNQYGEAPWSVVEDVTFANNIVRHAAAGINILGRDDLRPSEKAKRIRIKNNLFYDIGGAAWGGNGRFLQITETEDVSLDHNTIIHTGNVITAYGEPNIAFSFTNNLMPHNQYGIIGDGSQSGTLTIDKYLPASVFKKNVIAGGQAAAYPKKNYFPASLDDVGFVDRAGGNFRLASSSPYKGAGTKGKDIGADLDEIEKARDR